MNAQTSPLTRWMVTRWHEAASPPEPDAATAVAFPRRSGLFVPLRGQLRERRHPSQLGVALVDLLTRQPAHALGPELLDVERREHRPVGHRASQLGLVGERIGALRRQVAEEAARERVARPRRVLDVLERERRQREEAVADEQRRPVLALLGDDDAGPHAHRLARRAHEVRLLREHPHLVVAEVVADRADDAHRAEEASRKRERHRRAAEHATALAERRLHCVERDRSHHHQRHERREAYGIARTGEAVSCSRVPACARAAGTIRRRRFVLKSPTLRAGNAARTGEAVSGSIGSPRMRAIQIQEFGGPELMNLVDLPVPEPAGDQVLIRVTRAGVNFADTHQRENVYIRRFELPLIPGGEVAGTVVRGGGFAEGQRVIAMTGAGGYAEYVAAPAEATFPIPDGVEDELALALLIQGLTAWHLFRTSAQLRPGESVVVHSAAGGVGSLAVQLARPFGAGRVIASASSDDKRRQTLELGADVAIDSRAEELGDAIRQANDGGEVDVVLEMAGGRSFDQSLEALAPFGRLVLYGLATREQSEIRNGRLLRGSLGIVGFWLMHLLPRRDMLEGPLRDLFERAARGELKAVVGGTYGLSEARRAHADLLARRTAGKLVLDPAR